MPNRVTMHLAAI